MKPRRRTLSPMSPKASALNAWSLINCAIGFDEVAGQDYRSSTYYAARVKLIETASALKQRKGPFTVTRAHWMITPSLIVAYERASAEVIVIPPGNEEQFERIILWIAQALDTQNLAKLGTLPEPSPA